MVSLHHFSTFLMFVCVLVLGIWLTEGGWVAGSNLMAPDEFKNLGFAEEGEGKGEGIPGHAGGATKLRVRDDGKKIS